MNWKRVLLGALAGGVVWSIWSTIINAAVMRHIYIAAGHAGQIFMQPRYGTGAFLFWWFVTLFLLSGIFAWLYAAVRRSLGPGPKTAVMLGVVVGFAIAFPISLEITNWLPVVRIIPLAWLVDLWVGAILATFVAGMLYKDATPSAA